MWAQQVRNAISNVGIYDVTQPIDIKNRQTERYNECTSPKLIFKII